jgi:hypothetical protein
VYVLSFYSTRHGSYRKTWGPTVGSEVFATLYNIYGLNG